MQHHGDRNIQSLSSCPHRVLFEENRFRKLKSWFDAAHNFGLRSPLIKGKDFNLLGNQCVVENNVLNYGGRCHGNLPPRGPNETLLDCTQSASARGVAAVT